MNESRETGVRGIHHVSVMAVDAQENADFYVGVLGMRMVKRTVNQDDPHTYHLFYADAKGHAGSDLTFFIWPNMAAAHSGTGQSVEVGLAVPRKSFDWWKNRLADLPVKVGKEERRFGERVLPLTDPHGLALALVETDPQAVFEAWRGSPIPEDHQIRGLFGVRTLEHQGSGTVPFLSEVMGFTEIGAEEGWRRFATAGGGSGRVIDLQLRPKQEIGRLGRGSIHHVAWNLGAPEEQTAFQQKLASVGLNPTPVIDRFWFKSVYFHEPGGALFEAATEGPGFLIDEAEDGLGERLILPPKFEAQRDEIERRLPTFTLPQVVPANRMT